MKRKNCLWGMAIALLLLTFAGCPTDGALTGSPSGDPNKAAMPTANPPAGAVLSGTPITLATGTAGAAIYYTTDGSEPSTSSTRTEYSDSTKPAITAAAMIKAVAVKDGMTDSAVLTAAYTISQAAMPTANPPAGAVLSGTQITLATTTDGAAMYYTIDNSEPSTSSTEYTSAITVTTAATIKAVAVKSGMTDSAVLTAAYTMRTYYAAGDTSPAGGKIFYAKAAVSEGWRYLEAAPANIAGTFAWASSAFETTGISGTGTAIGTGKANTAAILAVDANAPAAKACANYNLNGYSGWFLPSIDELNAMYQQRDTIGDFGANWYWSSSQSYLNYAWTQRFYSGNQGVNVNKKDTYSVWAVRAF